MTKRRFSTTLSSRVGLHAEMQPHNDSIKPYFVRNEKKILPMSRYLKMSILSAKLFQKILSNIRSVKCGDLLLEHFIR